jgi:hypothetical protein
MINIFARSARNELKSLPIDFGERLLKRIELLIKNARPAGSKKLSGSKDLFVSWLHLTEFHTTIKICNDHQGL